MFDLKPKKKKSALMIETARKGLPMDVPERPQIADTTPRPMEPVRPRVVPDAPVTEDLGYSDSNADAMRPPTNVQRTQAEIDRIQGKDYSIVKDPDTGAVTHRGADRDKKWSLGEKIGSFLMGMFNGDGAVNAAMDRNYLERKQDQRDLGYLMPRLKQQQQAEDFERDQQYKQSQIDYNIIRPQLEQQRIDDLSRYRDDQIDVRQQQNDIRQQQQDLREKTQKWKETDRLEYHQLEREKFEALKQNRKDLYELAVRRQIAIEKKNEATEQGRMTRLQMSIEAKRLAAEVRDAEANGRQEKAIEARERLAKLKAEYEK